MPFNNINILNKHIHNITYPMHTLKLTDCIMTDNCIIYAILYILY